MKQSMPYSHYSRLTALALRVLRAPTAVTLILVLAGCAGPVIKPPPVPERASPLAACHNFYQRLDQAAQEAGVEDAMAQRLNGAPYLRVSRFLASFDPAELEPDAYHRWLEQLNDLARDGLTMEWHRLPVSSKQALHSHWPTEAANIHQLLTDCGQRLVAHLSNGPRLDAITPDDHYQTWKRWVGLYPLVMLPFRWGVVREHGDIARSQARHLTALNAHSIEGWAAFATPGPRESITGAQAILAQSPRDALGIPQLTSEHKAQLLSAFMPGLAIEADAGKLADNDWPAQLRINSEGEIQADRQAPSLYTHITRGRYRDQVTVQLNYSVWFSERRPEGGVDLLAGDYNGVTWRVHLNSSGEVLGYDKMHQCGCWYQFFPTPAFTPQPELPFGQEPVYIGATLDPGENHTLWLEANTHMLLGVTAQAPEGEPRALQVHSYHQLRALPDGNGHHHSPFDHNGLVPESRRPERFLFWPMGIASPGALRIQGTHAIAFIGRRHFDDPRLLEELGL